MPSRGMTAHVRTGTPERAVQNVKAREAARASEPVPRECLLRPWRPPPPPGKWRAKEPARQRHLLRLWTLPGTAARRHMANVPATLG